MRVIPYKQFKDDQNAVDTFGILILFLNDARQGGVDYEEMGRRIDLVKKIRALEPKDGQTIDGMTVDNDEYQLLKGIEKYRFPWGANEHVYEIVGDVKNAKAPPAVINMTDGKSEKAA